MPSVFSDVVNTVTGNCIFTLMASKMKSKQRVRPEMGGGCRRSERENVTKRKIKFYQKWSWEIEASLRI